VGLVPLPERCSVDLDDGRLDDGVGSDKLVVGSVVNDTNNSGLAGGVLGRPREVAGLETQSAVLEVSSTSTHGVDTPSSKPVEEEVVSIDSLR
jgi:hypothetical protein